MPQLYVSAAKREVTPLPEMLPMPSGTPFCGQYVNKIFDRGFTRALALKSGDRTALLIVTDIIEFANSKDIIAILSAETGVAKEDIIILATHAHASVVILQSVAKLEAEAPDSHELAYLRYLYRQTADAAKEAVATLRPAKIGLGYGESHINTNRNQLYSDGYKLGVNPYGPSNKTAAVVRFEDLDGNPIAFLLNYAVHGVVMHFNRPDPENPTMMGYSTDIPGVTSALFEEKFPEAVAFWTSGAAGDQNPIFMTAAYSPDPKDGTFRSTNISGGGYELLTILAERHFDDLLKINKGIVCEHTDLAVKTAQTDAILPGRKILREGNPRFGRIIGYENEGEFKIPMQLLQIGDLKLCCLAGELFTTLGADIQAVSPDTLILTHSMDRCGYFPDDEGIINEYFGAVVNYQPGFASTILPQSYQQMLDTAK